MKKRASFTEQSVTFSQTVEFFYQTARIHGRSRKTHLIYEWVFGTFSKHLRGDVPLEAIDTATLRAYFSSRLEQGYRPSSLSMHYRTLHTLFAWAVRERLIRANPLDGIPKPKMPKIFPFMLDESQVVALVQACDTSSKYGCRNYAILLILLDCGLRLNELIGLRLDDVSLLQRSLKVHGKGAKDRIVYMGAKTAKALRHWIEVRGFKVGYADNLFISRTGEILKPRHVQYIIIEIGKRSGLKMRLSPHKLRHVSATLAVKHGMDTFTLQRLYGWENVQTAMRYVNAASPALREAHAKASPV
ncbi:tyrosine-type recombinase/integrase, partial [Candidatus Acetothermia bacterium]|nr:tyrosine-type recombinase/integrase [Candidatus Acetothermia bacterium]